MAMAAHMRLKLLRVSAVSKNQIRWKKYVNPGDRNILSLHDRGIFANIFPEEKSPALYNHLMGKSQSVYCGFDPTADSLHIGNLLGIIALIHCQRAGHQALALIGGATALIGDPSGHTKDRKPLDLETLQRNIEGLRGSLERIFTNHHSYIWRSDGDKQLQPVKVLDNAEWYSKRNVTEFLSTVGRVFRVGSMLNAQSVKIRLNSSEGMNFTEFSYPIFQAYDFLHLYREHNCLIQIGGSDQLANITAGHELIKRVAKKNAYGLLIPLLTAASGEKLGKSAGNSVWLNPDKTSPFHFYQHFLNVKDSDMEKFLKLFTFLSLDEINDVIYKHKRMPEKRHAQHILAAEVTTLVHGERGLDSAEKCTGALFQNSPEALASLGEPEIEELLKNIPTSSLILDPGMTVIDLVLKAKFFNREVDAERVIRGGGVFINHQRVTEPEFALIKGQHVLHNNITFIRVGKKSNYHLIKWVDL